jgi:hypothetical protein
MKANAHFWILCIRTYLTAELRSVYLRSLNDTEAEFIC